MKSRYSSMIVPFSFFIVFLLNGSVYSDVIWTKSFNYSGKIIKEDPDYVIIKMAAGVKKISRKKIEDITYSKNTSLPPEEKEKIQKAGESLDKAVREQLKWRREHPKEYARQLKKEEKARKKAEAQEKARLKKIRVEEKREEARLQRLLEEEIRAEAAAQKKAMLLEKQARQKAAAEKRKKLDAQKKAPPDSEKKSNPDAASKPTPGK